ncbi:MAG: hypothetical protein ACK5GN_12745 [Pseudomonadota bacterium]
MVEETELELRLYRDKIVSELERRMRVLQDVEQRLARAQYIFDKASQASRIGSGSTARRQVENAHRTKLRSALKALEREKIEAKTDFERAEQRLKEVDLRLDELHKEHEEA